MEKGRSSFAGGIMEDLARAEWDFSTCPMDELQFCLFYEYAREDARLIRRCAHMESKSGLEDH